jgi:hypothetical protein
MKFGKGMADKAGRAMVKKMATGGRAFSDNIRANVAAKNAATAAKVAKLTPSSLERIAATKARRSAPLAAPSNPSGGLSSKLGAATAANSISRAGGISSAIGKAAAANQNTRAKGPGMKKGGSVFRKRADGVAHKGKTKGKMVKMAYGGKC